MLKIRSYRSKSGTLFNLAQFQRKAPLYRRIFSKFKAPLGDRKIFALVPGLLCPILLDFYVFWGLHSLGYWECQCLLCGLNPCPSLNHLCKRYLGENSIITRGIFLSFNILIIVQPSTQRILFTQIYMFQIFVNHNVSSLVSDMIKPYIFFPLICPCKPFLSSF